MKYTFNLKEPKSENETLILFSCYFKEVNKKFGYSAGEKIIPKNWHFENRFFFTTGINKSKFSESMDMLT